MKVGKRIRKARENRGFTQDELAVKVNVSRAAVAQWETDRCLPSRQNIYKISQELNVSAAYLTTGDTESLAPEEQKFLRIYQACNRTDRNLIASIAERLAHF